ncbi:MAG: tetratricopeptide repeat protein, partial [Planctomycetota bacterium]
PDAALAWSKRALDMAEAATEPRARGWRGTLYNNLGWTYHESGDFEQALSMFEASLAIEQKDGQTRLIGIARWSIAKTLRHLDRLDEALAIQTELLDHPDRQNNTSEGYTREELGECLLALDQANEAASHFARAWSLLHADDWLRSQQADRLDRLKRLGKVEAD